MQKPLDQTIEFPWNISAHQLFRYLLGIQLIVAIALGVMTDSLSMALLVGIPVISLPIFLGLTAPHSPISRHSVGIAVQLMCALHIQQTFGMTEMHFQIFVLLAFLFFYRDWTVIVSSTLVVAVHHIGFFVAQSYGMNLIAYPVDNLTFYILVIHAVFAIAECAVLSFMAHKSKIEAQVSIQLTEAIKTITARDSVVDLSQLHKEQKGTVGDLYRMLNSVKELIDKVSTVGSSLTLLVGDVKQTSSTLNSSVDKQDHQVSSISTAIQQMTVSIDEVARLSQNVNQIAASSKNSTDNTVNAISGSSDTIANLRSILENTASTISDLSTKCENISTVMQSIKSVAEQTNLLALNAAIESARAGEHGRGFAVVADEVRNLAIKSKESAEEIEHITSELTSSANVSVDNMQNCVEIVKEAVDASNTATDNMQQVMHGIDEVADNVTTVTGAASEQVTSSESISASAQELYDLFSQEKTQVRGLDEDLKQLTKLADELSEQLQHFKVA